MQISRLFETVYLLMNRPRTARELAAHFEVSVRTVYRDVDTLAQAGIPVYAQKGTGGGIRLSERFVLNKSVLTEEERRGILSSLQGLRAAHPEEAGPALQKLSALFGDAGADWIEVDFSYWDVQNPLSARFALLREAILMRHAVAFRYSGMEGGADERCVEPAKLVFRGMNWYLWGYCRRRKDWRMFKLSRMEGLHELPETFAPRIPPALPDSPPMDSGPPEQLCVRVASGAVYRARDDFPEDACEHQADGSLVVRFSRPAGAWLYEYLLTYGAALEVLSPAHVREELLRRAKEICRLYEI